MNKYAVLKQKMEQRRKELTERLERIRQDLARPHASDWPEQAQERENDEVLDQLGGKVEQELQGINSALERLQNNQYGICTRCAAEIPLARLEIKPETPLCIKCAA